MDINTNIEIFKDKTLSELLENIYTNSKKKGKQIDELISTLTKMIHNLNDAALVVPLVKEYLDIAVKNDDQLVKLASIIQRLMANVQSSEGTGEYILTDTERKQLLELASSKAEIVKIQPESIHVGPST